MNLQFCLLGFRNTNAPARNRGIWPLVYLYFHLNHGVMQFWHLTRRFAEVFAESALDAPSCPQLCGVDGAVWRLRLYRSPAWGESVETRLGTLLGVGWTVWDEKREMWGRES